MKKFYNFIRISLGWIIRILYPVKIVGDKKNIPADGKIVLISNHLSFRDIPVLIAAFPGYRHFLAKKEFAKNKFAKWLFTKMGVFFVDRDHMDLGAIRTGINYLKNNEGITVFPEGTRNRQNEDLQQIKGGAAMFAIKGQAPLIPVLFQRKIRPFRRTYIYVGDRIDLSEFYGHRVGSEELDRASKLIGERMEEHKEFIDDYVINKRWKQKG